MQTLIDYWDAYHERYEFLRINCKEIVRGKIELELRKQCAIAISRTWRWFYNVPQKTRDYDFINDLNNYTVYNYPVLGDQGWPISLRVCMFLARGKIVISFGCAYAMNLVYWNIKYGHAALWP